MVLTRTPSSENNQPDLDNMEFYSENESDICIPYSNSRGATNIEIANLLDLERDHEDLTKDSWK